MNKELDIPRTPPRATIFGWKLLARLMISCLRSSNAALAASMSGSSTT